MRVIGERRASLRAALEQGQAIVFVENKRVRARPIDISTNGMALALPATVELGTYLRVNFALRSATGQDHWVDVDGVVTRAAMQSSERFLALQFSVIEGHVALLIHEYVERHRHLQTRRMQAATYVERYEKGKTNRYLEAMADPAAAPPPGTPEGPVAAPVTGEYAPVEVGRETSSWAKAGSDADTKSDASREATDAHARPRKLEHLYREALLQLESERAKRSR